MDRPWLKKGDDNPYTEAELEVVRDTGLTLGEAASKLGRPYGGVKKKAAELGVKRRRGAWQPWEVEVLEDVSLPLTEVAVRVGRKLGSVSAEASVRGIVRGVQHGSQHYRWCNGNYAPTYRGADWVRVRGEVLVRDGYTCRDCGFFQPSGQDLHVHHLIPFNLRPVNDPEWLVTLCELCHRKRPEHLWTEIPEDIALLLRSGRSERGEQSA